MSQAIQSEPGYPSLMTVVNLFRAMVNDPKGEVIQTPLINASTGAVITVSVSDVTDPAPGQIVTGEVTICATILASAVRYVIRKMRNISTQSLLVDNVCFFNLPVVNSPTFGVGTPDPSVQVNLGYTGFFDGVQVNPNFLFPSNVLLVTEVWERLSNSGDDFKKLDRAQNGLAGSAQNAFSMGAWELRGDTLWMNGCTQNLDIRLRGWMKVPTLAFSQSVDYTQTFIQIPDCEEATALACKYFYDVMQGSGSPESMQALQLAKSDLDEAILDLRMTQVRGMQGRAFNRTPYGDESGDWANFGQ